MRKLLALALVLFLVFPLVGGALALMSVSQWVLDRNFYEQLLGNKQLYEVLLAEDIPNYLNNRHPVAEADMIPAGALSNALREVVSADDLQAQSMRLVNNVFDALEGRSTAIDLYLDTTQIKAALQGAGGSRFARTLAASLPACYAGQQPVASGGVLLRCRPSNLSVDAAAQQIEEALPGFVQTVPDRIDLQRGSFNWQSDFRGVTGIFAATSGLNVAIVFTLFFAGGVWLIGALLATDETRERLLWLGFTLLIPAALIFAIGVATNSPFTYGWVRFGLNEARFGGHVYSPAFYQALVASAGPVLQTIANGFMSVGGAASAIALGLIVWGLYTPDERRRQPAVSTPAAPADNGGTTTGTTDSTAA